MEPEKTCNIPMKLSVREPIVKIASGKKFVRFFFVFVVLDAVYWLLISPKGNDHVVMVTLGGKLYTAGTGEQGQLGRVAEMLSNRGGRRGLGE